ncbi:helix-turn-helix domain-containing protein [Symbiobacterium thermophilum]|uniref:helix-turn-helix domain-containing protein n=1 Tax=Symbiobacterium thermophilum TaxID=2734 RepID=UPI0002EA22AE|nr:helix-turn-helix transcriptional regulator [Symbiobacterium thermophilum]
MNKSNPWHIGRRIAALRAAHGDSLRQAAARTGVSHTTIGRLEAGQASASLNSTLRKIAEGYGVTVEYLLTGRDPQRDFEGALRRLPPEDRARLYFASPLTRLRLVLRFLMSEYPAEFPEETLAERLCLSVEELRRLAGTGELTLSDDHVAAMAERLEQLTAIPVHWFMAGFNGELSPCIPPERLAAYARIVEKAAVAGIRPDVLDMAIDLLILQHNELAADHQAAARRNG